MKLSEFLRKHVSDHEAIQIYILMKNAIPTPVSPVTCIFESGDPYDDVLMMYESCELAGLSVEKETTTNRPYLAIYLYDRASE